MELAFEKFEAQRFQFLDSVDNILANEGRTTGIIVDVGDQSCYTSAIFEGHRANNQNIGVREMVGCSGREISLNFMHELGRQTGKYFTKSVDQHETVRDIKEQCLVVKTPGHDADMIEYLLPDGNEILKIPSNLRH